MNVLYVCADRGIPVLGSKGASAHVRSLATAMQQLGHRVTLVARRWDGDNPAPRVHRAEQLEKHPDDAAAQLEAMIRAEQPDVVIERYSLQSGAVRTATHRCGCALTLEVNAPLVEEATRYRGLKDPSAEEREHRTFRAADRIHVVSSALERYVRSVAPQVPVAWIPNGADVQRFRSVPSTALPALAGRTVVGFVGSMKPWHGVEHLLDAFARVHRTHPTTVLVLVGSGPEQAQLIERGTRAGLSRSMVCTGHVPHCAVPSLIARFDIAVAPYVPVEQFYFHPLKVVEYLAAGKAVVYADQGDLRALVGVAGVPYQPGSVGQLADALAQLIVDRALRRKLAASAAAAGAGLDWSVTAARLVRFAAGLSDGGPADPIPTTAAAA